MAAKAVHAGVPTCALYVSAASLEAFEFALGVAPDAVIIDLEDGTPAAERELARLGLPYLIGRCRAAGSVPVVRVNGRGTEWHDDDLAAAIEARPDAVLVPKADPDAVTTAASRLAPAGIAMWAMVESARAVLGVRSVIAAAPLGSVVLGYGDLCKDLGLELGTEHAEFDGVRRLVLDEASRRDVPVLDGVVFARDGAEVEAACRATFVQGFAGRTLYLPSHVAPCKFAARSLRQAL